MFRVKPLFQLVFILLLTVCFCSLPARADAQAAIKANDINLTSEMVFLPDPQQQYDAGDVISGKITEGWQSLDDRQFYRKSQVINYWFRVRVDPSRVGTPGEETFIYIPRTKQWVHDIEFWHYQETVRHLGAIGVFREDFSLGQRSLVYAVPLPEDARPFWLVGRIRNMELANLQFHLATESVVDDYRIDHRNVTIGSYGAICALVVYNLLLFIFMRPERYRYYYLSYLMFALLCLSLTDGVFHRVFVDLKDVYFPFLAGATFGLVLLNLLFVYHFLNKIEYAPRLRTWVRGLIALGVIAIPLLILIGASRVFVVAPIYAGLAIVTFTTVIVVGVIKQARFAPFLLCSQLVLAIFASLYLLALHNVIEPGFFTVYALHFGVLAEAIMLSIVVAAKNNHAIQEKFEAQKSAKEALEIATRRKNEFLSNVSHELRTPLTSIIGFAEVILDKQLVVNRGSEYITTILREGKHLLGIIDNVLNLALIDSGNLKNMKDTVYIEDLVRKIDVKYRPKALDKGLNYAIDIAPAVPASFIADENKLTKSLIHLVDNAIKFTHEGSVKVHIDIDESEQLTIAVSDTGIGIDNEMIDQLLAPFTQADASSKRTYAGMGVGLFIVTAFVNHMEGTVSAKSSVNEGTVFRIAIPIESLDQIDSSHEALASPYLKSKVIPQLHGHVLYAEDSINNQKLIEVLLKPTGLKLTMVDNGARAVELLQENNDVDLVLMDLQMPMLSGEEAAQILKDAGIDIPIIAFSASALEEVGATHLFDDYLGKPVTSFQLYTLLEKYLPPQVAGGEKQALSY